MNSKLASLLCCLIMLINFSGCTKVTQLVKDAQPTKRNCRRNQEEHRVRRRFLLPTQHHICGITMTPLMPRNQPITLLTPTANTMQQRIKSGRSERRCELSLRRILL